MDTKLIETLALALTEANTPDSVIEIVRWILDEVCGEAGTPEYSPEARFLVESIFEGYGCTSTANAILGAATVGCGLAERASSYPAALLQVEMG